MKEAKDNFSDQAGEYAKYRPSYPQELYDYLLELVPEKKLAWDCATGNGQVATALAEYFDEVYATDLSEKQLAHAPKAPNIVYKIERVEQNEFPDAIFDLVTVGQAIHWFDFPLFFKETERVLKAGGILGVWAYELVRLSPEVDKVLDHFYQQVLGEFWDPERRHIDSHYASIPFPGWKEVMRPTFSIKQKWHIDQLIGYVGTWSAVRKFRIQIKKDPIPAFRKSLVEAWPKSHKLEASIGLMSWIGRKE